MAFDWNEYIVLAEKLIQQEPSEAELRSAISRAYYGAFINCRNKTHFSGTRTPDVHQKVIEHFRREDATGIELTIANSLASLRKKRNDSDYDGYYSTNKIEVSNHINTAKSIVKFLRQLED